MSFDCVHALGKHEIRVYRLAYEGGPEHEEFYPPLVSHYLLDIDLD
jgi:hypothetical protein